MTQAIWAQAKRLKRYLFFLYLPALLLLGTVLYLNISQDIPLFLATRDPAAVAEINPFIGIASNLGVLLWAATATACFLGATILHSRPQQALAPLLYSAGSLTLLLMLDDLFLLHETIFFTQLGLPEKLVFALYGCLLLLMLIRYRMVILQTHYLILLVSLLCFFLSLLVDAFQDRLQLLLGGGRIFLEDGFKLLGIVGWFGYFMHSAFTGLRSATQTS